MEFRCRKSKDKFVCSVCPKASLPLAILRGGSSRDLSAVNRELAHPSHINPLFNIHSQT